LAWCPRVPFRSGVSFPFTFFFGLSFQLKGFAMSSRTRTRWGIALAVLAVFVVGFTAAEWMPGFAEEPAATPAKPRFTTWFGARQKLRSAEEFDRNEGYGEQNKRVGLEVRYDNSAGAAVYTLTESGAIAAAPVRPNFALRTLTNPKGGVFGYRFHQYTGEAWMWVAGNVWKQIAPPAAVGIYDLVLTPIPDAIAVNVMLIEQISGETWWIHAGDAPVKLAETGEPAAGAQGSGAAAATPVNFTDNLVGSQWSYGPDWKFDFGKTKIENFSNGWWAMVTWKVIGPNQIELTNPESVASTTMTMTFDTADSYTTTDWDGTKMTGRRLGPAASK